MPLPNSLAFDSKFPVGSKPILCYVTDRRSLQTAPQKGLLEPLLEKIEEVAAAGVDWIQIREKDLSGKGSATVARGALNRLLKLARPVQAQGRISARVLVNDRLDVALAEQAGGVHLGENSLPVDEAKRLIVASQASQTLPLDFLVGVSCHSLEAAQAAASAGADYIFFGPVFATPSKAAFGAPQGIVRLTEVCRAVAVPVLALGGITLANAPSCFSAGASGLAGIRLFQDSVDPAELTRKLRQQRF
ncbi:MAG: thiamine phosphate synthase [Candidatus Acidiferrum sp.]